MWWTLGITQEGTVHANFWSFKPGTGVRWFGGRSNVSLWCSWGTVVQMQICPHVSGLLWGTQRVVIGYSRFCGRCMILLVLLRV